MTTLFWIRMKNLALWFILISCDTASSFSDITNAVFSTDNSGVIAAFGDFNSDKITDLFRIVDNRTVDVLIGHAKEPLLRKTLSCSVEKNEVISAVMPGDFNGDSMMDLLIVVQVPPNVTSEVRILWGYLNDIKCDTKNSASTIRVKTQPLLLDYNGDMIPDLFGENENGTRSFWIAQSGMFLREDAPAVSLSQNIRVPHSCSFTDLDFDGTADLFVTGTKKMEHWYHESGSFGFPKSKLFDYPNETSFHGQSVFVDLNTDGILEHVLPVCRDAECKSCAIVVRSLNCSQWQVLSDKFVYNDQKWCFYFSNAYPVSIRSGDINLDGFPDFVVVLKNQSESRSAAVLLRNDECRGCPLGRKLEPIWDLVEMENLRSVRLAAFYDIYDDGILDLLVTNEDSKSLQIHAIQNTYSDDAYFIKVIVIGGLCNACPDGHAAYGTNQPGPYIKYTTTKSDSTSQVGSATQLYQSAHFSLQLPYVVFGLAQTTNFVDSLQVVIPASNQTVIRERTWTQLIPNSQMVVIPYPPDDSRWWLNKLFVTPSRLVLLTLAALIGTCLVIGLIIAALYWKERREDRREKLLEAHRFHFDAM